MLVLARVSRLFFELVLLLFILPLFVLVPFDLPLELSLESMSLVVELLRLLVLVSVLSDLPPFESANGVSVFLLVVAELALALELSLALPLFL